MSPVRWLWRVPRRWFIAVALAIPLGCLIDTQLSLSEGGQWALSAVVWLVVLSVLPFTAPFDVVSSAPVASIFGRVTHWQPAKRNESLDMDPSALTVPPLVSVQSPAQMVDCDFDSVAPTEVHVARSLAGLFWRTRIPPLGPPASRPLALRL